MYEDHVLFTSDRFRVLDRIYVDADGQSRSRHVIAHPGAVAVIPFLDEDTVCLIENRRVAVAETLIEFPAGTVESGESPSETAPRELAEECGYEADTWEPLTDFWMSPGILAERMHVFVARRLREVPRAPQPDEEIQVLRLRWDQLREHIAKGRVKDAKTIAAFLFYDSFCR